MLPFIINDDLINGDGSAHGSEWHGIDLVLHAPPTMYVSLVAQDQSASLEFGGGSIRLGVDVDASPWEGIDLCRSDGMPWVSYGQPPANVTFSASTHVSLEVGEPTAHSDLTLEALSAQALEVGLPGVLVAIRPPSAGVSLEVGDPGPNVTTGRVSGVIALEVGNPTASGAYLARGFDLARWMPPSVSLAASLIDAPTAQPLDFGETGAPMVSLKVPPALAMELGRITIDRGAAC